MPRRQKQHHYIYKTTCLVTGKFYVGMHSTDSLEDGYLGSGKILRYSINKHGAENHRKEILEFCPTREVLKDREKEIVNEALLADPLNINLKYGGEGGWEHQNSNAEIQRRKGLKGNARMKELANDEQWAAARSASVSLSMKEQYLSGVRQKTSWSEAATAASQTAEIWKKRKATWQKIGFQQGEKNSQFGSKWFWINKSGEVKRIRQCDAQPFLDDGWTRGINPSLPKTDKRQEKIDAILNSKIDVGVKGWAKEMAKVTNTTRTSIKVFIKKNLPSLWQRCFIEVAKRRNNAREVNVERTTVS